MYKSADILRKNIEKRLKALRWNQDKLAEESGMAPSQLSPYLREENPTVPSLMVIDRLAYALAVPPWELLQDFEYTASAIHELADCWANVRAKVDSLVPPTKEKVPRKKAEIVTLPQPPLKPVLTLLVGKVKRAEEKREGQMPKYTYQAPAGTPSSGDEGIEEWVSLNQELVRNWETSVVMKVKGNSMEPDVRDGEMLVVDKSAPWEEGKVVVAMVHGEQTVKRLKKIGGRLFLTPSNGDYKALPVDEETLIIGVVTGTYRVGI